MRRIAAKKTPDPFAFSQTATFTPDFEDPNGNTPTAWTLYWGDGDEGQGFYNDPTSFTHVYSIAPDGGGDWTVAAMVSDADGQYWADEATVSVESDTPTLSLTGSATVTAGRGDYFNATFTDAAGRSPYDWQIDWGDGSGSTFYNGGAPQVAHTYTMAGSYEIEATAVVPSVDPNATANVSYTTEVPVDVIDAASFSFSLYGDNEGVSVQAQAHFSDPDGATVTSYTVDWGDGHSDTYGPNPNYNGVFEHTYTEASAPGDYTVSMVASTSEGDFTSSQTFEMDPASPWLSVEDAGQADSGQPFYAQAYFAYDLVGNVSSKFPVPGQSVVYTVDWGDGDVESYDTSNFTHVYEYDYSGTAANEYAYFVTATTGEYSATCYNIVAIDTPGAGELAGGSVPDDVTEGTVATFSGPSFSDDQQTDNGEEGADYAVWWGDETESSFNTVGEEDPSAFAPTHTYAEPGTYLVTYNASYFEDNGIIHTVMNEPQTLVVAEATPTLSASADSDSIGIDGDYVLHPTYTDSAGDHRADQLTIAWGDGQTNVYSGAPGEITHAYTTTGTFEPQLSLSAYLDDGHITATAPEVDVSAATVSIIAQGYATAYENGQYAAEFEVTRADYADNNDSLVVSYSLGGTLDTSAYLVTDSDGEVLDGTVTIPEGQDYDYFDVVPLEDHTPRWTDTVNITLTSGTGYTPASDASAAGCYVVNDDLSVYLDNGSDNQILEGSSDGESNLVPLVLDLPDEVRNGAVITLTDDADTKADVWMTSDPGEDDTPILGDADGTYVGSVTWTQGVSDDAPSGKTTLYVGGTDGSSSLNDISFGLSDDDANCTEDGTDSDPHVAQDPPPQPTTSNSKQGNGTTDVTLEITSLLDPNPGEPTGNVAGITRDWLAGQEVLLQAKVVGPQFFERYDTFNWTVPGNALYGYYDSDADAGTIALAPVQDEAFPGFGTPTGTATDEVQFFWVHTAAAGPDTDVVSVTANGPGGLFLPGSAPTLTAETTFTLSEPTSQLTVASQGSTQVFPINGNEYIILFGDRTAANPSQGIEVSGGVQIPAGFTAGQGQWKIVQLEKPSRQSTVQLTGGDMSEQSEIEVDSNGVAFDTDWVLDAGDPYTEWINAAVPPGGFPTGPVSETMDDTPGSKLQGINVDPNFPGISEYVKRIDIQDTFSDVLMYSPPGAGSTWVPVESLGWHWTANAFGGGDFGYGSSGTGPAPTGAVLDSAEPVWSQNTIGAKMLLVT